MIFVPFTGVDHHKKCTVFGAGLLHNETIESYSWLLRVFLKVHGKQPVLVLTDQDPAMKQAVELVLDKSVHRLCMWHILEKIPLKVLFYLIYICVYSKFGSLHSFIIIIYVYVYL